MVVPISNRIFPMTHIHVESACVCRITESCEWRRCASAAAAIFSSSVNISLLNSRKCDGSAVECSLLVRTRCSSVEMENWALDDAIESCDAADDTESSLQTLFLLFTVAVRSFSFDAAVPVRRFVGVLLLFELLPLVLLCVAKCLRKYACRLKYLPHKSHGNCTAFSSDSVASVDFLFISSFGLCHRRCDAKFAGQLNRLPHSGHRYSSNTMHEHRCRAKPNASSNSIWHNLHKYAPITFGMAAISAFASSVTSTILYCGSMSPDSCGMLSSISSNARIIVPDTGDDFFSSNFNLRTALTRLCSFGAAVPELVADLCALGIAVTLTCFPFGVTSFLAIFDGCATISMMAGSDFATDSTASFASVAAAAHSALAMASNRWWYGRFLSGDRCGECGGVIWPKIVGFTVRSSGVSTDTYWILKLYGKSATVVSNPEFSFPYFALLTADNARYDFEVAIPALYSDLFFTFSFSNIFYCFFTFVCWSRYSLDSEPKERNKQNKNWTKIFTYCVCVCLCRITRIASSRVCVNHSTVTTKMTAFVLRFTYLCLNRAPSFSIPIMLFSNECFIHYAVLLPPPLPSSSPSLPLPLLLLLLLLLCVPRASCTIVVWLGVARCCVCVYIFMY